MSSQELVAVVNAWQASALSREPMLDCFRRGDILPEGRTNAEETKLLQVEKTAPPVAPPLRASSKPRMKSVHVG